jgi:hypothetical protein
MGHKLDLLALLLGPRTMLLAEKCPALSEKSHVINFYLLSFFNVFFFFLSLFICLLLFSRLCITFDTFVAFHFLFFFLILPFFSCNFSNSSAGSHIFLLWKQKNCFVPIRAVLVDCVARCLCLFYARSQIIIVDKLATCLLTIKRDDGFSPWQTHLSFHIHFPQFREKLRNVPGFLYFILQNQSLQFDAL